MATADLFITFTGMALVGYGNRGEAWLIDTAKVPIGVHRHQHDLGIGSDTISLEGGQLVTFEENGVRLNGAVDFGGVALKMVDLDALMPEAPRLKPELTTDAPAANGDWTNLLAAWIRLPRGTVNAQAKACDVWPFARDPVRQVSEQFSITVPNVTDPVVAITHPNATTDRSAIPMTGGKFRVRITTVFVGPASTPPDIGQMFSLEEVGLLYGCLTNGNRGDTPTRPFTQADQDALPRQSHDVSVCPSGCLRL